MKQILSLCSTCLCLALVLVLSPVLCRAQQTTLISDTLYEANGSKAQGTATITWPAFTSPDGFPIAQGTLNITISNGAVSVQLVPTQGATPAGTSYTVNYFLANSVTYTEYWTVPTTGPVTLTQVRTTPVPVPTTTFGEQQLTLGNGLQTLLGVWKQSSGPVPNAEGQCYWNTTSHAVMCTDQTLTFNALGGSDPTRVSKAGDTMSGSLLAANTTVQLGSSTNPFGALFQNQSSGTTAPISFNTTTINNGGHTVTIADGLAGNNVGDRAAVFWNVSTDGTTSTPNFSNQEGLYLNMVSTNGQNDADQSAKKTFFGILNRNTHYGAGQRIAQGNQLTCYGMGDCFETSDAVNMFGGVNASGDEGTGFRSMTLQQGTQLATATITSIPPQTTCNTTVTQAVTKNIASQQVTVASTTGCNPGDWVVLDEGAPYISDTNLEAVQLIAVSPGVITAIFVRNHLSGETVTPATRINVSGTGQMGQLRYLVNLSQPPYSAGTVSGISGRTLTGSGTTWTPSMVGGNSNDAGCITMPADDYTSSPFSSSSALRSWYPIQIVNSSTSLTIEHQSVIGGVGYSGNGPGSGAYTVAPCVRILNFAFTSSSVGNTLILENNSFTWSVGDTVEAAYSVNGDVAGEYMRVGWFMPGAALRSIYNAVNVGAQPFNSAFSSGAQMTVPNTTAFIAGLSLQAQMQTGISMSGLATSGVGISMANYPGDNKAIQWSNASIYQNSSSGDFVLTRGVNDTTQPTLTLTNPPGSSAASINTYGSLQVSYISNPKIRLQNTFGGGSVGYEFRNLQTGTLFPQPGLEVYADPIGRSFFGIFPGFGLMTTNSSGPATLAGNSLSYAQSYNFETFNGVSSDVRYVHSLVVPASGVIATSTVAPVEWQLRTNMGAPSLATPFAGISNSGTLRFGNPSQGLLSLNASAITASRTLTAPDASGTIALTTTPGASGTAPNWTAIGGLNIPMAASGGTTAGLLANSDYLLFSAKQNALTFTTPLSASNNTISCSTCEVTTNKNIASGYAGLTSSTKLVTSQGQQVWAVTDLTTYTSTSGHGSTALQSTISSPTSGQVLTWSGTDWVNQSPPATTHNLLSNTHTDTTPASVVRGDMITGQGSATTWQRLPLGSSGKYLRSNGTDVTYSSVAAGGVGNCTTNQWVNAANDNAAPSCTQPAFSDLSGAATSGQLPASVVYNNLGNTYTTGLQDFTSASEVLPKSSDPATPATGQVWINSGALKYRDNSGSPNTQTVEIQSNKNQPSGYAGLTSAAVLAAAQFPAMTGDITTASGSLTATLPNIVTAGTNTKITYNAKGQVTSSAQAAAADLSNGTTGTGAIALASSPTVTDLTANQNANGDDVIAGKRKTDISPTGNFLHFQNAASSADLWTVDATGTLQSGSIPGARVSGSIAGNAATATALAVTPAQCSASQYATGVAASGNATCSQVAYSQLSGTPTLFYQTVQSNTTAQNQRANLNYSTNFSLADSSANNRTTVDLAATISSSTTGNAGTATALAATPTQCSVNQFSTGVTASGSANCAQPAATSLTNGTTGTGAVVLATSPTITTPTISGALGGNLDLGSNGIVLEIANETSTGTGVNQLAKLTGATSAAIKTATSDTVGAIGVVVAGAGISGNAQIARTGLAACAFDGGTIAGDYVQISSSVAGDCHDAGSAVPLSGQIIGRILTTNGSSGTFTILVTPGQLPAMPRVYFAGLGNAKVSASSSEYFFAAGLATTAESAFQIPMPAAGVARGISCIINGSQPSTGSLVFTWRQNATSPSGGVAVTIPASSAAGVYSDSSHSVVLNAGDLIDIQATNNATSLSATIGGCSLVLQ